MVAINLLMWERSINKYYIIRVLFSPMLIFSIKLWNNSGVNLYKANSSFFILLGTVNGFV